MERVIPAVNKRATKKTAISRLYGDKNRNSEPSVEKPSC